MKLFDSSICSARVHCLICRDPGPKGQRRRAHWLQTMADVHIQDFECPHAVDWLKEPLEGGEQVNSVRPQPNRRREPMKTIVARIDAMPLDSLQAGILKGLLEASRRGK